MNALTPVGVVAALIAAAAVLALVRPVLGLRMAWPALGAGVLTAALTIVTGTLLGVASPAFLIGLSALALPVLLLLEAAAVASGADAFARRLLMGAWGLVVFPVAALVPLALTTGCLAPDCGFEDFGGALPLVVSSAAFVVLAWLPVGVHERAELDRASGRRAVIAGLVLWIAVSVWLIHLEGAIDEFTARIALAAVVGPAGGAIGWLVVDLLRDTRRTTGRSLMLGLVAGMVAVLPSAVSVGMPWAPVVGVLAGGLASLVYSLPGSRPAGLAARWGMTILVAAAIGFLAPAVSGDTVGIIFTARAAVLIVPLAAFFGVATFAILVSAPVWVLVRRHAARERIPQQILADE